MLRSIRFRAAMLLIGAVSALGGAASKMDVIWIAGYLTGSQAAMDYGNTGIIVGGTVAGIGSWVAKTGVGASWGSAMVAAGTGAMVIGG